MPAREQLPEALKGLERFDPCRRRPGEMDPEFDGEWVRFSDVAAALSDQEGKALTALFELRDEFYRRQQKAVEDGKLEKEAHGENIGQARIESFNAGAANLVRDKLLPLLLASTPDQDGGVVEKQVAVVTDFLDAWRFCPVAQSENPSRRPCLEDAAKQLVAALRGRTDAR